MSTKVTFTPSQAVEATARPTERPSRFSTSSESQTVLPSSTRPGRVMAPSAASLAQRLNLNPDPFLMAVAIGAACDFLTPIGHQCNTLVMGPGGYRFGDYWRLGLPLSVIVVVVSLISIPIFWPLRALG